MNKFIVILLSLGLSACNTAPQKTTDDEIQDVLKEGIAYQSKPAPQLQPTPDVVNQALLPNVNLGAGANAQSKPAPRFDLSVNDVDARAFFMGLVEGTDQNMVVHPEVSGTISLTLKNVTVEEVMDVVRDVYGYEYRIGATGFQVLPRRLQTRIFEVSYLNVIRAGRSKTRVSSGQITQPSAESSNSSDNNTTTTSGSNDLTDISGSQVETDSEADFWKELNNALRAIVSNSPGGNVVVNPQSGIVIVRALPSEIRDIENFLQNTRNSVTRQVILEAKILEVDLKDGFRSGINYTALFEPGQGKTGVVGQTDGGTIFSGSRGVGDLTIDSINNGGGLVNSAFGGIFSLALNLNDFTAFIELLETQGNVKVLSSPRIATVNNQKAVIKVGTDEFFVTEVSSTTVTGTATSTTPEITLTPFFSGIALDVIPQIDKSGNVILHIHPTVSDVNEQTKNITVAGQTQSLPLASSSVRESDSIVRAKSGQIIVIGGLMTNSTQEDVAGTPILSDLPLVGSLFKHRREQVRKSELVILLKPHVVDSDQTWRDALQRTSASFSRINGTGVQ